MFEFRTPNFESTIRFVCDALVMVNLARHFGGIEDKHEVSRKFHVLARNHDRHPLPIRGRQAAVRGPVPADLTDEQAFGVCVIQRAQRRDAVLKKKIILKTLFKCERDVCLSRHHALDDFTIIVYGVMSA